MKNTGRNDPCPCGSGKKFKHCCLGQGAPAPAPPVATGPHLLLNAEAHFRAGRLEEALALCETILQADPQHPPALFLSGLIALRAREYPVAIDLLTRAVARSPDNLVYLNTLGMAHHGASDFQRATECFHGALALRPDFAEAHCNLGVMLAKGGRIPEAMSHYRQALASNPRMVEVQINLGNLCRDQVQLEEALEHYRQAIALNPERADAHAGLAMTLFDFGRLDETRHAVDRALQLDPEQVQALGLFCRARKMGRDDGPWRDTVERLLARTHPPLPVEEAITLGFALGKFHDDLSQYDHAFAAYRQANTLRRQVIGPFDRHAFTRLIDAIIRAYPAERIRQRSPTAHPSRRPVLIAGMPRSGTSLVEQIIAAHPEAFGAGELFYWTDQARADKATIIGGGFDATTLARLAADYETLLTQLAPHASRVVDKMPTNFLWLGLIHLAFPEARIIHTRRDPVDTCLSIYFQNFKRDHTYATDLADLAFYYQEYDRLMQHWRASLPRDRFLEIDYEALVEDQEAWSQRLLDHVGLDWDPQCIAFHTVERKVATASNWQVRQPVYQTSKARWQHYAQHLGPLLGLHPPPPSGN